VSALAGTAYAQRRVAEAKIAKKRIGTSVKARRDNNPAPLGAILWPYKVLHPRDLSENMRNSLRNSGNTIPECVRIEWGA
jgi:hypothetical protein